MKSGTRRDAWEMALQESVRQELYALTKAPTDAEREARRPWLRDFRRDVVPHLEAAGIAVPAQSSWYRFLGRMREAEAARIALSVETAARIARGVARANIDPKLASRMFTGLSVDAATQGNDEAAKMLADAAAKYHAAALGTEKLRLDEARQRTADETLRLAREKFEAAEKRLAQMAEVADAAREGKVDPARVADEIDRILGRRT